MDKTTDHYPTDRRKTGQVSAYRNEYETDCSDESIMFDSDKTDLEVSRDRRNGVERELKKTKQKSYNERDDRLSKQTISGCWRIRSSSSRLDKTRRTVSNMFLVLILFRNKMSWGLTMKAKTWTKKLTLRFNRRWLWKRYGPNWTKWQSQEHGRGNVITTFN